LPETLIYTTKGPIEIQDVTINETEVYNLKGGVENVENVLEHPYSGDLIKLKIQHSIDDLEITGEHPIYLLKNQKRGLNYSVIKNRLDKKLITFEWTEAKEINTNDMIVFPIPTYYKDLSHITEDDCYIYGVILGDGCMNNKITNGYISLHTTNKKHILEKVERYFNSKYIKYRIEINDNTTRIYWNKTINMPFRYNDIYDNNKEKYCHHRWLNLPINKSKHIIKGLVETDGSIGNEIVFDSTSRNLIESVRFLCLKLGILTSGNVRNRIGESHKTFRGDITNKKISYSLRIPKTKEICDLLELNYESDFFKFFKYNNYLLSRITGISKSEYNGTLYDLQFKNEHNYLLHNGIVHNGGGKRNGSIAIYLEPWHKDIFDWLLLRKNHGNEEDRARDLFYALWVSDLFMERVKENGKWTLFCPDEAPGLADCYGDEFKELYLKYEGDSQYNGETIEARKLWYAILESQIETGTPYMCYKDAANKKSNQKNLGTIKSSNLCTEIMEYSSAKEYAVCNLASIALSKFVNIETREFDYDLLCKITKVITKNLNKVIDINYYPIPECETSNKLHRPIGIGVQGLADVFALMKVGFDSDEAQIINTNIFETIYYGAIETSLEISVKRELHMKQIKDLIKKIDAGKSCSNEKESESINEMKKELLNLKKIYKPLKEELNRDKYLGSYSSFEGSPMSKGAFQFDMWGGHNSNRYNWGEMREKIKTHGIRNSLLLAPMPTASTSQIMGNNECIEPFTSNIYLRRTLAGEFVVINKYLIADLLELNIWNETIKNLIIKNNGSVQSIDEIPDNIKAIYKTVWEIGNKTLINMAADRGKYICQSQSLNLFVEKPDFNRLSSMHFYSWDKGLKTGMYYLRTKPVAQAQQFTIEPEKNETKFVCRKDDPDCLMCGS
jgi:ribonucleotide reductase alpha subunit